MIYLDLRDMTEPDKMWNNIVEPVIKLMIF